MCTISENAKAIFLEAVEKYSPEDWPDFLERACADDRELRAHVEGLLHAHSEKDSLFDRGEATRDYQPLIRPGQTIGPYKIREQIGDGGMGVVYVAEQERPLRRKVALKVIKPGMDSQAVLARFDAERNALAMMNHPNIAKVLDAGTTDQGHPYFVMELIQGKPITEYCDQKKLTIPERLELFTQICNAVQHAHQKGVIHRDIKPANILITEIDGKPVPKVIDFGVAKALGANLTDRTVYTSFQALIGTPLYMSPEQTQLSGVDVDTSSDVYSLGILLYELLTGTTPLSPEELKQAAQDEVLRRIRETEPPRPSNRISSLGETSSQISECRGAQSEQLGRLVRGDLDWIVMKALEKDRNRRYKTADAFAADIGRHLTNVPVEARPPSAAYRASRFYARNRLAISAAAVVSLSLILGATVAVSEAIRASNALKSFREIAFEQGVNYVLSAEESRAKEVLEQLHKDPGAIDYANRIAAIIHLHEQKFLEAIEILEDLEDQYPNDVGVKAMLTDAYDGLGDIRRFLESQDEFRRLVRDLDDSDLNTIELIYAALASIGRPIEGHEFAERALKQHPTSHYARLIRGRLAADRVITTGDDVVQSSDRVERSRIAQAVEDVDSLKLLYHYDSRIPSLSLSTYLTASRVASRAGDNSLSKQYLDKAATVASHLRSAKRTSWESFFLAQYQYDISNDDAGRQRAQELYKEAAIENQDYHDYSAEFCIALGCELKIPPSDELEQKIKQKIKLNRSTFGTHALGFWYALQGKDEEAIEQADRLVQNGAIGFALEIYLLMQEPKKAKELLQKHYERISREQEADQSSAFPAVIVDYFAHEFGGHGSVNGDFLLDTARKSEYPCRDLSMAYWTIGLRQWCAGDPAYEESFQRCLDQRQCGWAHYSWCRSLLARDDLAPRHAAAVGEPSEE